MKVIHLAFFGLLLCSLPLMGQEDEYPGPAPLHPNFEEPYCPVPKLVGKAVIHYQGYSRVFLEFDESVVGRNVAVQTIESSFAEGALMSSSDLLLDAVPPDTELEITVTDDCGQLVTLGSISTNPTDAATYGIEVSDRMYQAIKDFQNMEASVPFSAYLEELPTVSPYEKIAFIQQYYYNGARFQQDMGTVIPVIPGPPGPGPDDDDDDDDDGGGGDEDCRCRFVFNTTQIATPAQLMSGVLGHVHEKSQHSNGDHKIPFQKDARYWWFRNTKGPGKWHYAWTEGWKAGGNHYAYNYNVVEDSFESPHHAQLAYNFFCTNYEQLPRECECTKRLRLYYRYDTRVVAHGKLLGSSLWDRTAEARAQDIGVATLKIGNQQVQVLDAGDVRAEAQCSSGTNGEWFLELLDVAEQVAYLVLALEGNSNPSPQQLEQLVGTIAEELGDLITTPIYNYGECETVVADETLAFDGPFELDVPANTEIRLNLMSFTSQRVGGKRKWFSYSGVESGFYMVGMIMGGIVKEGPEECCTNKMANWIYGSCDDCDSYPTHIYETQVGAILGLWAPWNLPVDPWSGAVDMPSEYGRTEYVVECGTIDPLRPVVMPTGTTPMAPAVLPPSQPEPTVVEVGEDGETTWHPQTTNPAPETDEMFVPEQVVIFDVNGRIVYRGNDTVTPATLGFFMDQRGINRSAGIYFVHLFGKEGQRKTYKVFLPN